jgi:1-acyl-sn-glycerol-3-phosphate acyltransferase
MPVRFFRIIFRLLGLIWVIISGMMALTWFLARAGSDEATSRIAWMGWMSRRFLALLHCEVKVVGKVPESGLIACNHLGYVDILVIGSVCPAVFVAKSDVKFWPIFGWLASRAGTIFVSRDDRVQVATQLKEMESPLRQGHPVVLFPEGTSSDGSSVLPFRSSLFESVISTGSPITPSAIGYDLGGEGSVGDEIAYWGDLVLLPHLLNLLSKKTFTAHLAFGTSRSPMPDRKQEATLLHTEVSALQRTLS